MVSKTVLIAPVVLVALVLAYVTPVSAQTISNAAECTQAVADAKAARESEPDIGDKSGKVFEDIVELAVQRCAEKEWAYADQLLNVARGMVASE